MGFVRAVEVNIAHGLPLSLADREAAAARIIASYPQWSDRAVAASTGLAAATVAAIRRRSTDQATQSNVRIGRDGKVRPINSAEGRRRASALLAARPDTSLRQVAKAAGISVGTAKDVRERLRRGDDPLPDRLRARSERRTSRAVRPLRPRLGVSTEVDRARLLETLRKDPALRFSQAGRALLRLFTVQSVGLGPWDDLIHSTPPHCLPAMARLARSYAETWQRLAADLDRRANVG